MKRASLRTLVLLLELFAAVAAFQYMAAIGPATAGATWVAGDCTGAVPLPGDINDCTMDS